MSRGRNSSGPTAFRRIFLSLTVIAAASVTFAAAYDDRDNKRRDPNEPNAEGRSRRADSPRRQESTPPQNTSPRNVPRPERGSPPPNATPNPRPSSGAWGGHRQPERESQPGPGAGSPAGRHSQPNAGNAPSNPNIASPYGDRGQRQSGRSNPNFEKPPSAPGPQHPGGYERRNIETRPNNPSPSREYSGPGPAGYENRGQRSNSGGSPSADHGGQRSSGYGPPDGRNRPRDFSSPESRQTLQQINRQRTEGHGVNSRPLPSGEVTRRPGGDYSLQTRTGRAYSVRSNGSLDTYRGRNNSEARFRPDGSVRVVRRNETTIFHGPANSRRIVRERPDHSRFVANGAGHGYIQRSFQARQGSYVQRTYYHQRAPFTRFYRPFSYHGLLLNRYVPARFHSAAYYSWAYSTWRTPVYYRWAWFGTPWFSFYGPYFSPYRAYPSADFWLTDYVLAMTLEAAYQERVDAGFRDPLAASQPLSPSVKQMIADEVHHQLVEEQAGSQYAAQYEDARPEADIFAGSSPRVLVASEAIDTVAGSGDCTIMPGDVVQLYGMPAPDAVSADVRILATSSNGCPAGTVVPVSLNDIQEMQNHLRATIDEGLSDLQSRQGRDGIPAAPVAALRGDIDTAYALDAPPLEPNGAAQLSQEVQYANQAEQDVIGEALAPEAEEAMAPTVGPPPSNQPATVWVFRTKGNVFRPSVFVNGEDLVRLGGGRRCMLLLPPGPASFQLDNPRAEVLPLDLLPGEVYFLEGRFSAERKDYLELVHPAQGEQEIRRLQPVEAQWIKRPDLAIAR